MDLGADRGDDRPGWERFRPHAAWTLAACPMAWLLLRLSGLGRGTVIETLLVFTPFVALASLVILAVVAWLRVRPAAWLAGAGALGLVLVVLPLVRGGAQPGADADGPPLTVMTVNALYGEADPDVIVDLVRANSVDVLGVQELTPALVEGLAGAGLTEALPHSHILSAEGAAGMGIYADRPFEDVSLSIGGEVPSPTARFELDGTPPVEVTVVHPLPPLGGWREDWSATLATLPAPAPDLTRIVMGDFNATLDQPTMRDVLDLGFVDAAQVVGRGWVPTWGPSGRPVLAIDRVLVDHTVRVESVEVHAVAGSDHRAVIAVLQLP